MCVLSIYQSVLDGFCCTYTAVFCVALLDLFSINLLNCFLSLRILLTFIISCGGKSHNSCMWYVKACFLLF